MFVHGVEQWWIQWDKWMGKRGICTTHTHTTRGKVIALLNLRALCKYGVSNLHLHWLCANMVFFAFIDWSGVTPPPPPKSALPYKPKSRSTTVEV